MKTKYLGAASRPRAITHAGKVDTPLPVPLILQLISSALSSGAALPKTFIVVGQSIGGTEGAQLNSVGRALLLGAHWDNAWELGPPRLEILHQSLAHSWEFGAPVAIALERASVLQQQEAGSRARQASARLAVRLVLPLGLCFLPAFVFLGVIPLIVQFAQPILIGS